MKRYRSTYNDTYHLINNGVRGSSLYRDDNDKTYFCKLMEASARKYNISVHAYALMENHYHICASATNGDYNDIALFMRGLNSPYVRYYNKTDPIDEKGHMRRGTIFCSTYTSVPVNEKVQFENLVAYIHKNPSSTGENIEEYKWSSYHRYIDVLSGKETEEETNIIGNIPLSMSFFKNHTVDDLRKKVKTDMDDMFADGHGEYQGKNFMSDSLLKLIVLETLKINVFDIKAMKKAEKEKALYDISLIKGTSKTQIARVYCMSYSYACRLINKSTHKVANFVVGNGNTVKEKSVATAKTK